MLFDMTTFDVPFCKAKAETPSFSPIMHFSIMTFAMTSPPACNKNPNLHFSIHGVSNPKEAAKHCFREMKPAITAVRDVVDELEGIVADDYWPLPTYQEMLFIK